MSTFNPANVRCLVVCILPALALLACGSLEPTDALIGKSKDLSPPVSTNRPLRDDLREFGRLVRAYRGSEEECLIAIDFIGNNSGVREELPVDINFYVEQAINDIGAPFRTFQTLPAHRLLSTPAGSGFALNEKPDRRAYGFRIRGNLMRYAERVVRANEARADALFVIKGGDGDAQLAGDNRITIHSVRVGLSLDGPDGKLLPSGTASYEVFASREDDQFSIGLYIEGTGIGVGGESRVVQDVADAIQDATAACVMRLVGHALRIPYYRCSSIFSEDAEVNESFRRDMERRTELELDRELKWYLYLSGEPVDMNEPNEVGERDRALIDSLLNKQPRRARSSRERKVDLLCRLWRHLDYEHACELVEDRLAQLVREAQDDPQLSQPAPTAPATSESEGESRAGGNGYGIGVADLRTLASLFGWPNGTTCLAIDLSELSDGELGGVIEIARHQPEFRDIRVIRGTKIFGVRFEGKSTFVQAALRSSDRFARYHLIWRDSGRRVLGVRPRSG